MPIAHFIVVVVCNHEWFGEGVIRFHLSGFRDGCGRTLDVERPHVPSLGIWCLGLRIMIVIIIIRGVIRNKLYVVFWSWSAVARIRALY